VFPIFSLRDPLPFLTLFANVFSRLKGRHGA